MGRRKNEPFFKRTTSYRKRNRKYKNIFEPQIIKIRKKLFNPCENCPKNVRTLFEVPVKRFINPKEFVLKKLCDECTKGAQKNQKLQNSYCEFCEVFVNKPTRKCDTCNKFVCDVTMCWENLNCEHAKTTHTPALICHDCIKYCSYCSFRFCSKCFDKKSKKCPSCVLIHEKDK